MTMVEIPAELLAAAGLNPEDVKTELALELFRQRRIPAEQFRSLLGDSLYLEEAFSMESTHPQGICKFRKKGQTGQIDLDAFISWAAHDIKSPLNAMIGFTKVVLKGIDGPVNELQVSDLTTAHASGQRMLDITNNLVDMARLNRGELTVEMIPGDLFQTVVDAATRWKTKNSARELQTKIEFDVPIFSFDPSRLRQVITGLLTYAANHVEEGGHVSLTVREMESTHDLLSKSLSMGHSILFNISSSGEKARDKFEMDLAMLAFICDGLIRLHNGSLSIGEDTGHGLALNFSLPLG